MLPSSWFVGGAVEAVEALLVVRCRTMIAAFALFWVLCALCLQRSFTFGAPAMSDRYKLLGLRCGVVCCSMKESLAYRSKRDV